ncbi:hypothetical protein [Williamsia serinedens]|uniref:Uncharacterized protein n=1 Tax=Williamsia serinedens TaxID=391736 RepID=A0ABT1H1X6_9NOCA|nr:hypothetical protein [Williamsia serinedens]MCP2161218.1 hypothetical protein [Williamsia serinedens]
MRRVTVVLPLAAAVVALAGCSSSDDSADAVQSSASATTSISTSAVASAPTATATAEEDPGEPTETGTATQVVPPAAATTTVTAAPADDVDCSLATPSALLTAVQATEIYGRMAKPVAFGDIRCAGPFATGRSAPPGTQAARVLFRYEGGDWVALDLGSAIDYQRWGATPDQASRLNG